MIIGYLMAQHKEYTVCTKSQTLTQIRLMDFVDPAADLRAASLLNLSVYFLWDPVLLAVSG